MAAKVEKLKVSDPFMDKNRPDRMDMNLGSDSKNMPSCELGDTVTITITGKVTRLSEDEYGKSFAMEVKKVEKYEEED